MMNTTQSPPPSDAIAQVLTDLRSQKLLVVNQRRRNGLIIYKQHHAEFAGPGAVVGSVFDTDVLNVLPVGNWSLLPPKDPEERQKAYLMRRQWVKLFKQVTENPIPTQRVQAILNQFENWFDVETVAQLPNEAIAALVGVLPQTVHKVRNLTEW
ncbi:hypothetical protein PN441_03990 [Spirulina major CS-329]|jgi:hypothetical protein|uniref:hypothetical protein n=1 Tax=Spirulina TaxID=1154 RepID=UPI00232FAD1D|nr:MULTISPECIES: hypothetical protein [Spirulina]MDB9502220.1 hypothetical protein [Spirulina major CS-329]